MKIMVIMVVILLKIIRMIVKLNLIINPLLPKKKMWIGYKRQQKLSFYS